MGGEGTIELIHERQESVAPFHLSEARIIATREMESYALIPSNIVASGLASVSA